jgi:hypothetical protein
MSTYIAEPGTRLGGRYRLEDRVSSTADWSAWKAIDETLARPVAVLTFTPGFARIGQAVTAARAASRLTDARLAQVFDVEEDWEQAYVVMEWVGGDSLEDLLAAGPLDPALGAEIIAQAAEALAFAHTAGVAHLCLTPVSVRWSPQAGVKITGLGIDAALAGVTAEDPALADTRGLARLLYAALTGHWPGHDWPGLPAAPEVDGHPRSPRQVLAGVPAALDEITRRALAPRPGTDGQAITTPARLATALGRVIPAPALPPPAFPAASPARLAGPVRAGTSYWGPGRAAAAPGWRPPAGDTIPPAGPFTPQRPAPRRRRRAAPAALVILAVLVAVVAVVAGWRALHHSAAPGHRARASHTRAGGGSPVQVLKPVGASGFDPLSSVAADPQNENSDLARYAIDASLATFWHTQYYFSARFGGLKRGTGLLVDLGRPARLSSVTVTFGRVPGANVRIELGNSDVRSPATLGTFRAVARRDDVSGTVMFPVRSAATGRYVLIWFTKLPPLSPGRYEAKVYNVVVRGSR